MPWPIPMPGALRQPQADFSDDTSFSEQEPTDHQDHDQHALTLNPLSVETLRKCHERSRQLAVAESTHPQNFRVPLREILSETVEALALNGPRKPRVWIEVADDYEICATREGLHQIVRQMLETSLGGLKGRSSGHLWIRAIRDSLSFIRVEFADNGCGITPEKLARVFQLAEPQCVRVIERGEWRPALKNTARAVGNVGGDIGVESLRGEGTTFWISLPLADGGRSAISDIEGLPS